MKGLTAKRTVVVALVAVLLGWAATPAGAVSFTFTSGDLSASATFGTSGSNLIVTLTNTSTADVLAPSQVLTAVFFKIAGDPTLSPLSAVLGAGSTVLGGTTDPGGVVGGEWAFRSGIDDGTGSGHYGISSAGLGLFGPGDRFPGTNLQGPDSPDGIQYGITSAGDDPSTANGGLAGNALIQNSVVFTLSGLPAGFDLSSIYHVGVLYGTSLAVPEPPTLVLFGTGLIAVGLWGQRRLFKGFRK